MTPMPESSLHVCAVILDIDFMLENSPVFQAQVGEQMLALAAIGYRAGLVATYRERGRFDRAIGDRLTAAGIVVRLVPHASLPVNLTRVALAVRRLHRDRPIARGYARGIWGCLALRAALPMAPVPYVYDVRGALSDETRAGGSARAKASVFRAIERACVRHAKFVTAVSGPLADLLRRDYGRPDIRVIPSCVDLPALSVAAVDRLAARRAFGFADDEVVLTYCGGLDYYQRVPEMLQLWERMLDDPCVRFLLITNDAPRIRGAIGAIDRLGSRLVRASVPRAEVPRALAAGDVGFMLRDARVMNVAASPVKFAEYLAAGLAVVTSPRIGDLSDLVAERRLGILVSATAGTSGSAAEDVRRLVCAVRRDREGFRQRAFALAAERYDWTAHRAACTPDIYGGSPQPASCAAS